MYATEKINNVSCTVPELKKKPTKWKGSTCFPVQYFVMSILAKRKSGKTTVIYNILKQCFNKQTVILFFCPTFWKDDAYKAIRDMLDANNIIYSGYTHFLEDGIDHVEEFMTMCEEQKPVDSDQDESDDEDEKVDVCIPDRIEPQTISRKKKPKKKKQPPTEYILVFDDMSKALRQPSIIKLCKNSRHYRAKVILSSQSVGDLHPETHAQVDYSLIFKSFNDVSLQNLYDKLEIWISPEKFKRLYYEVTATPYNFLFIDRENQEFRENFNRKIIF